MKKVKKLLRKLKKGKFKETVIPQALKAEIIGEQLKELERTIVSGSGVRQPKGIVDSTTSDNQVNKRRNKIGYKNY